MVLGIIIVLLLIFACFFSVARGVIRMIYNFLQEFFEELYRGKRFAPTLSKLTASLILVFFVFLIISFI